MRKNVSYADLEAARIRVAVAERTLEETEFHFLLNQGWDVEYINARDRWSKGDITDVSRGDAIELEDSDHLAKVNQKVTAELKEDRSTS